MIASVVAGGNAAFGLASRLSPFGVETGLVHAAGDASRVSRGLHPKSLGQFRLQSFQGQGPVAGLGALVVGRHPHYGAEAFEQAGPLAGTE